MATQEELLRQQQQNIYSQAQDQIQPATTATTATYIDDSGNKQTGMNKQYIVGKDLTGKDIHQTIVDYVD